MKILIIGKTGAGKTHLAKELMKEGLIVAKSTTTRPKRYENENTYNFISREQAELIEENTKIAKTMHNDYEYFLTKEEIEKADVIVTDISGIKAIAKCVPNEIIHGLLIKPENDERRYEKLKARYDYNTDEIKQRDIEDKDLDNIETFLQNLGLINVQMIQVISHNYQGFDDTVDRLLNTRNLLQTAKAVVKSALKHDMFTQTPQGIKQVYEIDGETKTRYVPLEVFAYSLIFDDYGFDYIMKQWLVTITDKSNIIAEL